MFKGLSLFSILWVLLFSLPSHGKLFRNSYLSFELPSKWDCRREVTEWVCNSQYSKLAKEAIIILTAKEVGPPDTIANYYHHLKSPRPIPPGQGKARASKVIHVKRRRINNHEWVDGMHLGSEVYSYYSRYLGTVKGRIAILVTFSAHQKYYTKYSQDFLKAIQSLRVVAGKNILGGIGKPKLGSGKGRGQIGAPISDITIDMEQDEMVEEDSTGWGKNANTLIAIFFIIGAIGLYLFAKSGGKPKRKSCGRKK